MKNTLKHPAIAILTAKPTPMQLLCTSKTATCGTDNSKLLTVCKSVLKINLSATSIFSPTRPFFLTFKPFVNGFRERFEEDFGKVLKKAVSDSGYGSEENYDFMEIKDIEPFVKFSYFHKEQKKAFKNNAFIAQNLFYNKEKDFFVSPMGNIWKKRANEIVTRTVVLSRM